MVDSVLEQTCRVQHRVRDLQSRFVVYPLLAGCLFAELGYLQVWHRLTAGLDGLPAAAPTGSVMTRRGASRLGPGPLRELFARAARPLRGRGGGAAGGRGRRHDHAVTDSAANLAVYSKQRGGRNGDSGYPMMRLVALVSCGTRTVDTRRR